MAARNGPRAKNWCFTLNNYTPCDLDRLCSENLEDVEYIVFGKEVGESGTPHLQGTVCFGKRKRLTQVISIIGQAHCTVTRFLDQSVEYCKKDGEVYEYGTKPKGSGQRCELEEFKQSVKDGVTKMEELRELHSRVCAKFPRFVKDYLEDRKTRYKVDPHPLREWQAKLNDKLKRPPDSRKIIFVVDRDGNEGKSWFARYFCDLHDDAQIIIPGKKADMAYTLEDDKRVFFLDCPRSKQGEFIQYDFLEEMKNGYVFSPKYESKVKKFKPPHVVVLTNEMPDQTKLSEDRFELLILN